MALNPFGWTGRAGKSPQWMRIDFIWAKFGGDQ
jgi:hypothetical protein